MTRIFVTSDIHFNHVNILQYCTGRGSSVEEMNEKIIAAWNAVVTPDDVTYILGDVAMGKIADAPALIRRLNGVKHVILGNHDNTLKKLPEFDELFDIKAKYFELVHKVDGVKYFICMSHFPMAHWNGQHNGSLHLFGHLHGAKSDIIDTGKLRMMDVGIDTNNLTPYLLDDVVRILSTREMPLKDHHGKNL